MSVTTTTKPSLALLQPVGHDSSLSFVHTADRILRWTIDGNGHARLGPAAVDRVDRLVSALIRIREGQVADPAMTAKEALE